MLYLTISLLLDILALVQSLSRVRLFCNPKDCSPPGSSVHGTSQAGILVWVAVSLSWESSWTRYQTHASCIGRWIFFTTKPPGRLGYLCRLVLKHFGEVLFAITDRVSGSGESMLREGISRSGGQVLPAARSARSLEESWSCCTVPTSDHQGSFVSALEK